MADRRNRLDRNAVKPLSHFILPNPQRARQIFISRCCLIYPCYPGTLEMAVPFPPLSSEENADLQFSQLNFPGANREDPYSASAAQVHDPDLGRAGQEQAPNPLPLKILRITTLNSKIWRGFRGILSNPFILKDQIKK